MVPEASWGSLVMPMVPVHTIVRSPSQRELVLVTHVEVLVVHEVDAADGGLAADHVGRRWRRTDEQPRCRREEVDGPCSLPHVG